MKKVLFLILFSCGGLQPSWWSSCWLSQADEEEKLGEATHEAEKIAYSEMLRERDIKTFFKFMGRPDYYLGGSFFDWCLGRKDCSIRPQKEIDLIQRVLEKEGSSLFSRDENRGRIIEKAFAKLLENK